MIKLIDEIATAKYGFEIRMNADSMMLALGLKPSQKLPEEGMDKRLIQGVEVYVKSLRQAREEKPRSRRAHRVMALCTCGIEVPFGRLHQHKCRKCPLCKERPVEIDGECRKCFDETETGRGGV